MNYKDNKVNDIKITYIGGGSRGWAWNFMTDLSMDGQISGNMCLYDIDKDAAEHNKIIGNALTNKADSKGKWNYSTADSLKEALTGADFVVISILPGTFEEMRSDVHLPERYGIYQSVGDTAGPGGLVRALRTIPMFVEIAEAIKAYAKDAWVINYTNPMSLCVQTLYKVFPEIKAFGCCHEVFGTQKLLAQMCEEMLDIKDIDRSEILVNVLGINHFTWFDKASYKGIDLFPLYKEFSHKYYESGYSKGGDSNWMNNSFSSVQRVKFDLFKNYGLIAAAGDRHLAEFMPPIYLKDSETVKSWKFGLTTVDYREEDLKKRLARSERLVSGEEEIGTEPSGEEGILLIKSLAGLARTVSNVNIPNSGQIPNLPLGSIVETNALFERDHIAPVMAGSIPENVLELILPHVQNHADILEAALTYDRELAFKAFLNDPLMTISEADAKVLFDEMLENTKKYLPSNWF
ncbi:MAG: alpha-glucosidase/alpha-galactosidase [Clostridiales bacterium]|nr:alpha-glucosidase/alpha-galactosidase [Clostridiales bacterium]